MTEEEMVANGIAIAKKCYNGVIPIPDHAETRSYGGVTMKMFNDIWGNEQLSMREKRLIVIGVLAGLGADVSLFEIHAKSALKNKELSAEDLRAAVLMIYPYAGAPNTSPMFLASEKLIAEFEKG